MKKIIFISIVALSLVIVLSSFTVSSVVSYKNHINEHDRFLDVLMDNIIALKYDRQSLIEYLQNTSYGYFRSTYIAKDGSVLYDSKVDEKLMPSHLDRKEISLALLNGKGQDVRKSDTILQESHYLAYRLENGDVLRLSYTTNTIFGAMHEFFLVLILFSVAIIVVYIFLADKIATRIVKPINMAQENPEEYIKGYYELNPLQQRILTQKNELDKRVQESENIVRQFKNILNAVQEGLVILDKDFNILLINSSARKIFNYYSENKEHIFNACREEGFSDFINELAYNKADKYTLMRDNRVYSMHTSTVNNEDALQAYVLLIQDVTADYYGEKQRREFSANVSHELKTPLTTILGLSELIASGIAKKGDIANFAGKINAETKRLVRLVDDIIKLSHIDEGRSFNMQVIDLYDIAKEQVDRFLDIAVDMNISLDAEKAYIMGEEQLISDIIYNLIDNAVKYNKPDCDIKVIVKNKENGVLLAVKDNGIGIAPKHHARIFERFYRVDKSRSRNTGGTGLGLSIVKNVAVLHNAKLDIESDIGKGCCIKLKFPHVEQ